MCLPDRAEHVSQTNDTVHLVIMIEAAQPAQQMSHVSDSSSTSGQTVRAGRGRQLLRRLLGPWKKRPDDPMRDVGLLSDQLEWFFP